VTVASRTPGLAACWLVAVHLVRDIRAAGGSGRLRHYAAEWVPFTSL